MQLHFTIGATKKFCKNTKISDEELFNGFISTYVNAGNLRNKNGEPFWLNKSRVSEILKQKSDVPKVLRDGLQIIDIKETTIKNYPDFIEDYLDPTKLNEYQATLHSLSHKTDSLFDTLYMDTGKLPELLTYELFNAITESNLADNEPITIWKRGKNKLSVLEGDLFKFGFDNRSKNKNIVVIPVNTSFETHVTRKFEGEPTPIVSATSLHGQWLTRAKQSGLIDLDARIQRSLDLDKTMQTSSSSSKNTKVSCYPIGSIAVIEDKNSIYYLLAISHFNANNTAQSSSEDIKASVKNLIEYHNIHGQGYPLYIPMLGTGLSRAGLSYQDSYDIIKETLIGNSTLIQGNVFIIFPHDELSEIKL